MQFLLPLTFIALHQVDEIRSQITKLMDLLARFSILEWETGTQRLVTRDDLIETPAERLRIEPPDEPPRARNVVGGAPRLQLIDEPQPLLRIRERQLPIARNSRDRFHGRFAAPALLLFDLRRDGSHRRVREQLP